MEYLSSMPFPNKVYFSQNDLKVFGLLNISAQKTSIYISHRMLATKYCSRVLVFDNGHIIEDGSFEELLHNDGLFRKMYMSQSGVFQQEN